MSTTTPISSISAHGQGVTRIAFAKNGKKIYTGGDDCLVRVWETDGGADQEPKTMAEANESITALDTSREGWVAGGDDAMVRRYDGEADEMLGAVTQSAGVPVRCLAYNPQGDKLVVGSDDLNVKLIDVNDNLDITLLVGHTKGLRAATWHPSGSQLTTSGQDGKIIVWDCLESPPKSVHEIDGLILACSDPSAPEFSYSCAAVWHPSGNYFAVSSKAHEITIISKKDWKKTGTFSTDGHASDITALAWSSNGLYLASAGSDNTVLVWETERRKVIARQKVDSGSIVDLAWSPAANLLAWTDMDGAFVRWTAPVPASHPSPVGSSSRTNGASSKPKDKTSKVLEDLMDDGDDTAMDGDAPDDDLKLARDEDDEDWVENDLGEDFDMEKERAPGGLREMVNVTKAQPAFQPGSTPFKGKKRYLAFNSLGVIEVADQDIHNVVNIEFHDKSLRRGHHFQDVFKFSMAALGERGVAFACTSGESHEAILAYKPYDSWASNSDWQVNLPAGENPVAIAAGGLPFSKYMDKSDLGGNGNVAVATTKGYVRFFSGGGMQRYVWTVGGKVITMVGGPEWVFVVHREGGTSLDGCQNLRYTLISTDAFDIVQVGYLPLPKGTTLTWIGITEEGAPCMYDSDGILSVLDRFRRPTQGRWVPALDTNLLARKVGKDESYWPVSLSGKQFLCVILKGGERHPGFPRPVLHDIEVQMPLLSLDEPQGQAEERFLRESILLTMQKDASTDPDTTLAKEEITLDKTLLQLIQMACKSDKLQRALDLTRLLHHIPSFESAQKVAGFYHLVGLQEKMGFLRDWKEDLEGDGDIDPRKGWGRVTEPIGRGFDSGDVGGSRNRMDSFQDFGPPPAATRRTLARATPVGQVPFARPAPPPDLNVRRVDSPLPPVPHFSDTSMEVDVDSSFAFSDMDSFSSAAVAKRKRPEDEAESTDVGEGPSTKRPNANGTAKVTNAAPVPFAVPKTAPPKANANPFARKPAGDKVANPFSRNGKSLAKSNSFFDKVDAAEAEAASGKPRPKVKGKDASKPKQMTLFGKPAEPKAKAPKVKGKDESKGKEKEKGDEEPAEEESQGEMAQVMSTATNLFEDSQMETQEETQPETQETQPEDGAANEREPSPDWDLGDDETADEGIVAAS